MHQPHTTPLRQRLGRPVAIAALAAGALLLGACASKGPPPVEAMTAARASLTQAEAAGAGQHAPVELLATRDKLAQAEAAVRAEEFDRARRLAEQATADGMLAERKARAQRSRQAVTELERANATLQKEVGPRARP